MAANNMYTSNPAVPVGDAPAGAPGQVRQRANANGSGFPSREVLCFVPAALQGQIGLGQPYMITFSGTDNQNPQVAVANGSLSGVTHLVGVCMSDLNHTGGVPATGSVAWFATDGTVNALVDGTVAVAKGDYVRAYSVGSTTALVKDPTGPTTQSVGIAQAAQSTASAVSIQVFLFGDKSQSG